MCLLRQHRTGATPALSRVFSCALVWGGGAADPRGSDDLEGDLRHPGGACVGFWTQFCCGWFWTRPRAIFTPWGRRPHKGPQPEGTQRSFMGVPPAAGSGRWVEGLPPAEEPGFPTVARAVGPPETMPRLYVPHASLTALRGARGCPPGFSRGGDGGRPAPTGLSCHRGARPLQPLARCVTRASRTTSLLISLCGKHLFPCASVSF